MTPTTEELRTLAKYPFLSDAKQYVEEIGLSIGEVGEHPIYSAAINLAKQRIIDLTNKEFKPELDEKTNLELLIISYPIARILVNLVGNNVLTTRYSKAEANMVFQYLKTEKKDVIKRIKEDLKLKVGVSISLTDYLNLTKDLVKKEPGWRIVNRKVGKGEVWLKKGEELILIGEAVRQKVMEPLKIKKPPKSMEKALDGLREKFSAKIEESEVEFLEDRAIPPCMRYIISLMQRSEANHNARFILATFLIGLGLREDDVIKMFSNSPKFDESKTRYQIQFLAGQKSNTRYTCPACITIKSYGLCKADCNVKHPQQYYRNNARKK